jgi:hypothetical protein
VCRTLELPAFSRCGGPEVASRGPERAADGSFSPGGSCGFELRSQLA